MTRTFSEFALCHLPDTEIQHIQVMIGIGFTCAFQNEAGFFIWAKGDYGYSPLPVLTGILATVETDFALFDIDIEPDPELEIFDV